MGRHLVVVRDPFVPSLGHSAVVFVFVVVVPSLGHLVVVAVAVVVVVVVNVVPSHGHSVVLVVLPSLGHPLQDVGFP